MAKRPPRLESLEDRVVPAAVWTVRGTAADDVLVLTRVAGDPSTMRVILNGVTVGTRAVAGLRAVNLHGNNGNDTITIAPAANRSTGFAIGLHGGGGDDRLRGGRGNDRIYGGAGDDTMDGGVGNDILDGGDGDDDLHGGGGNDTIRGRGGRNTVYGRDAADRIALGTEDQVYDDANANPLHRAGSVNELRRWVVDTALQRWDGVLGKDADAAFAPERNGVAASEDFSNTNTQESGVGEADIVHTDGRYVYTLSGGKLVVVDVQTPETPTVVAELDAEGAQAFYLLGDRAVLLSQDYDYGGADVMASSSIARPGWFFGTPRTRVTTIDVSTPADPAVAHETMLDGWLVDSREVGGRLYVVVQNDLDVPTPVIDGEDYEDRAAYLTRLEDHFTDALPTYTTDDGEGGSLVEGADVYLPRRLTGSQLLSVGVFDPASDDAGPVAVTTTAGTSGTVYASTDSLYVASVDWSSMWWGGANTVTTQLAKFTLGSDAVPLAATGTVAGSVLNSFSMDEEGDQFRIATTSGWGDAASNAVYVMAQAGGELRVTGAITDLGLTEQIYSVRFDGDVGYVVTFRQIDPLFTLDLRDAAAPRVVGELKIPGYSSYLHPIGGGLMIGVGRDADEDGTVRGFQVSLFDVTDPANPLRVATYSFDAGEGWDGSATEWDHHAFSYFADPGVLAVPVTTYTPEGEMESRVEVLRVTGEGFESLGAVTHGTDVLRSLRIGDNLITLSYGHLVVSRLTEPGTVVGSVALPQYDGGDSPVWAF